MMNSASGMKILRSDLIRFLQARRHRVIGICPFDNAASRALQEIGLDLHNWPISRGGINVFRTVQSVLKLRRILLDTKPEVVLCFTPKAVLLGSIAAHTISKRNVYSVLTGLGFLFDQDSHIIQKLSTVVYMLFRYALKHNRLVFFQNPDDLELFVSKKIVPVEKARRVFGSGVDTTYFTPCTIPTTRLHTVFLMVSRLISAKGVLEYIEAARILKQQRYTATFRLLGPYDEHPTAVSPSTITAATRAGTIEYCGTTQDVRPYLRNAHVFVLPSYYREGTPRSALEALAMGKPIITTDSPGCRETVVQHRNGYLVPPRDPCSLADAMRSFVGNHEMIHLMGLRSRELAETVYDVDGVNLTLWNEVSRTLEVGP